MKSAAVIDKSVALKNLRSIEKVSKEFHTIPASQIEIDKNGIAESACRVIIELSKKYYVVIVPQVVVDEINDAATESTRLVFKRVLSTYNVIISDKPCDDIFAFAKNASIEFHCPIEIIAYDTDTYPGQRVRCTVTVF